MVIKVTYQQPVQSIRPNKSHRFDAYSPKLGRPITLFSYPQLNQWLLLEAFPAVKSFCERPDTLELQGGKQILIDYWIQRNRSEAFVVILCDDEPAPNLSKRPQTRLTFVRPKTLARWGTLANNWQSLLPYIVAQRNWCCDADMAKVVSLVEMPMTLKEIENQLTHLDSSTVRGYVFSALAKGLLRAPSLKNSLWQQNLLVLPALHGH